MQIIPRYGKTNTAQVPFNSKSCSLLTIPSHVPLRTAWQDFQKKFNEEPLFEFAETKWSSEGIIIVRVYVAAD